MTQKSDTIDSSKLDGNMYKRIIISYFGDPWDAHYVDGEVVDYDE